MQRTHRKWTQQPAYSAASALAIRLIGKPEMNTIIGGILMKDTLPHSPPQTATKQKKKLKKRGPKGNKIALAFKKIPHIAVDFNEFARVHNVSTNVLRQIKRHDIYSNSGQVFVRKDKNTKKMMIWRELK